MPGAAATAGPAPPATRPAPYAPHAADAGDMVLELADGTAYRGFSFGAPNKSVSGECVFQTGAYSSTMLAAVR